MFELVDDAQQRLTRSTLDQPGPADKLGLGEGGDQALLRVDGERPSPLGDQIAHQPPFAAPPTPRRPVGLLAWEQQRARMADQELLCRRESRRLVATVVGDRQAHRPTGAWRAQREGFAFLAVIERFQ